MSAEQIQNSAVVKKGWERNINAVKRNNDNNCLVPRNCSNMEINALFHSITGRCNNIKTPSQGASITPFARILKTNYTNDLPNDRQSKHNINIQK